MHLSLFQFYFSHRNKIIEMLEDFEGELKSNYNCNYKVLCLPQQSCQITFPSNSECLISVEIHIRIWWWNKECLPLKSPYTHANGSTTAAFSSCWEENRSIKVTRNTMEQNSHCQFVNELYTSADFVKGYLVSSHWLYVTILDMKLEHFAWNVKVGL